MSNLQKSSSENSYLTKKRSFFDFRFSKAISFRFSNEASESNG